MREIRRARPEEAQALTEIALAAKRSWGYPESWMALWTPLLTFKPEDLRAADVFVDVDQEVIAGFYRLIFRERRAVLDDLWVKPDFMGQGIGRALFEHAVSNCRTAKADILEVEADPHAQAFYEKMGMHKVGDRQYELEGRARRLPIMEIAL
jgi:ribosomal protein S18 acetylase RimI-like enzyme